MILVSLAGAFALMPGFHGAVGAFSFCSFPRVSSTMMDDLASELSGSRWRKRRRNANSISFRSGSLLAHRTRDSGECAAINN